MKGAETARAPPALPFPAPTRPRERARDRDNKNLLATALAWGHCWRHRWSCPGGEGSEERLERNSSFGCHGGNRDGDGMG